MSPTRFQKMFSLLLINSLTTRNTGHPVPFSFSRTQMHGPRLVLPLLQRCTVHQIHAYVVLH